MIEVGEFELNRNPDNYHADVEQAAFTPANLVPGIGLSPDRMLQARVFAYGDAARYRLGVNHYQIPVNYPRGVQNFHTNHRDGAMRVDGNGGSENSVATNSYGNWTDRRDLREPMLEGGDIGYHDFREDDSDYYTQPGKLFRRMTKEQQLVLFENTARNMGDSTLQIKHRHINNCYQADPEYGKGVADALGIDINSVDLTPTPRNSRKANEEANARGFEDLNVVTEPAHPETSRDLGPEGRDTNYPDPKSVIDPMEDPYFL